MKLIESDLMKISIVYPMFTLVEIKVRNFLIFSKLRTMYVTSAGFEPATFGAEIRNSIQLNYEAIFLEKS